MVRVHLIPFPVAIRLRETPVPIPNTMVKPEAAENTMLATVWEDRRLPGFNGGIAQLGEHLPCKQGVKGSNPFISTVVPRRTSASLQKGAGRTCRAAKILQRRKPDEIGTDTVITPSCTLTTAYKFNFFFSRIERFRETTLRKVFRRTNSKEFLNQFHC